MKPFAKLAKASKMTADGVTSALGFGCMGISSFYGEAMEEDAAMKLLQTVYDNGCRHFDTAELYSNEDPNKHNEKYLGRFLATVPRDSFTVATKYWPANNMSEYDRVKSHLQQSLDRLGLEYVDLYYSHRVPTLECGIAYVLSAKKLQEEGLIKAIGLSEVSGNWLKEIVTTTGVKIDAVQQEWSLLSRSLEEELVPVCKELDITIVAYSPLARNLLVQKLDAIPNDWRSTNPRYQQLEQNKKFADQVHDIAEKMKCTPAQLCLAWLFHKAGELGVSVVPIPGTTKPERAIGNIASTDIIDMDQDDLKVLDAMAKDVVGDRYDEGFMGGLMEGQQQQ
mmetsp:Transcript_1665/g.2386  ORF Transcript_1665/g.2386 Transcript_1665/m.2386 type:complete len:337 (+) Transcript_1665:192-1202(+)